MNSETHLDSSRDKTLLTAAWDEHYSLENVVGRPKLKAINSYVHLLTCIRVYALFLHSHFMEALYEHQRVKTKSSTVKILHSLPIIIDVGEDFSNLSRT